MFKTCKIEHVKVKGSKSSGMTIVLSSFWGSVKQYMLITYIYILYNYIYNYIYIYTMQQNHEPAHFRFSSYDLTWGDFDTLRHQNISKPGFYTHHSKDVNKRLHRPLLTGVRQTFRSKGWDKKTHTHTHTQVSTFTNHPSIIAEPLFHVYKIL